MFNTACLIEIIDNSVITKILMSQVSSLNNGEGFGKIKINIR